MDVSGQLYAPAAFSGGEKAHVPSGKETEWSCQESNPNSHLFQPINKLVTILTMIISAL